MENAIVPKFLIVEDGLAVTFFGPGPVKAAMTRGAMGFISLVGTGVLNYTALDGVDDARLNDEGDE